LKYHHHGYVSHDPRIQAPAGAGIDRPEELPERVDVLIVGAGPAGMITAAQLSQFPGIVTRIVDRRAGRLEVGLADGLQPRSLETFEAFGFAQRLAAEACHVTKTAFWKPDPQNPADIVRVSRVDEDPHDVSEYPHLTVNQARVLDYFAEFMTNAPTRMKPDYGYEFLGLTVADEGDYPVAVRLARVGDASGGQRIVHARYVVGADGGRSGVRKAIGLALQGVSSNHAWGVMDLLADTDFPDIRTKCAIQSEADGNILLIPREGGFLFRLYVDLGEVNESDAGAVRNMPAEQIIERAQRIFHPYRLDVREVAWHSVYEVGHRLCDHFDDAIPVAGKAPRSPRVFIAGDAGHTHSAKAGQGMNASMQDGFNLGWKLGHVLEGRSPARLLSTYSAERQKIGQDLIDQDLRWATQMAKSSEAFATHAEFEQAYLRITEFAQGFMTCYAPSMIVAPAAHQSLAAGYPVGKRFRSAEVMRVADANRLHLGHEARADGRWRIYVFADSTRAGEDSPLAALGRWLDESPESPIRGYTPAGLDENAWFDLKVIYQQDYAAVDIGRVPAVFLPRVGTHRLPDLENVYAALPDRDIFQLRGIDRQGAVVIVRPDQYVANVLPLTATDELAGFIRSFAARQQ
jgi:phenol 2-monooxygenase